jgi:hypothetical protein
VQKQEQEEADGDEDSPGAQGEKKTGEEQDRLTLPVAASRTPYHGRQADEQLKTYP